MSKTCFIKKDYIPQIEFEKLEDLSFIDYTDTYSLPFVIYVNGRGGVILDLYDEDDSWYEKGKLILNRDFPVLSKIIPYLSNKGYQLIGFESSDYVGVDDVLPENVFEFFDWSN
jgi:hypothetical protein